MLTKTLKIGIQQCKTNIELFKSRRNMESTAMTMLNCTKLLSHQYNALHEALRVGRSETYYELHTIGVCAGL